MGSRSKSARGRAGFSLRNCGGRAVGRRALALETLRGGALLVSARGCSIVSVAYGTRGCLAASASGGLLPLCGGLAAYEKLRARARQRLLSARWARVRPGCPASVGRLASWPSKIAEQKHVPCTSRDPHARGQQIDACGTSRCTAGKYHRPIEACRGSSACGFHTSYHHAKTMLDSAILHASVLRAQDTLLRVPPPVNAA